MLEGLKKRFMEKSVLVMPDLNRKLILGVKILYFAIRGVLKIRCKDKK